MNLRISRSAPTRRTFLYLIESNEAKFAEMIVLPSPLIEEVTKIRLLRLEFSLSNKTKFKFAITILILSATVSLESAVTIFSNDF